ncbi:bifunctional oligoribonuclease/PAP phosphatase NrnA [Mucilaginibacter limnophilus]|uniref:Bifunctional oligoribonuclease/PAP phosphatase NrnA n=1 Tax=Mucilaginibacter limnophilus TaxID=1932778 RepID=A0A3S2Y1H0_9SPHI|nr:DHH family phosphoesterase [Mucilaginibacter limnophilus]RVT98363.1 bifunctional oligoribonuclease/PAP phosphatase NrnA [Mucilaginibacter limnophilus]
MLDIASVARLLEQPRKIVITTHHKPDGDAMGSSLGLYNYLIQQGHHAKVITPSDYADFLNWMPGNEEVLIYTENTQLADTFIAEAEMIFCLDFNALSRINAMEASVRASSAAKLMIDHHLEPEDFDDFRYWDINACATAQLVYMFIADALNNKALINKDVATCLYTGILTDSASFKLPKTTAEVHIIAAELINAGAVNWRINELVYNSSSENRLRFLGNCLVNKLEVLNEYNTAIVSVTKAELEQYEVETGDTEGIVNYALSISNVRLAAFIVERTDEVKLSLRSKGEFPANEICKKYFAGGGHRNAAGGRSDEPLQAVIEKFKSILPDYKKLLIQ